MPRPRTTLPALLAQLPAYGQGALVQPAAWAERFPNSFYKITRTRLRVKADGSTQYLSRSAPRTTTTDEVKGKAREHSAVRAEEEEDFEDDAFGGDDMEIGQVDSAIDSEAPASASGATADLTGKKAHGQAWGVLFWNGQPKFPFKHNYSPPSATDAFTPHAKIRRALSDSWRAVDAASLPSATLRAVETLQSGKRRDWFARREKVPEMNLSVKDLAGLRRRQERAL